MISFTAALVNNAGERIVSRTHLREIVEPRHCAVHVHCVVVLFHLQSTPRQWKYHKDFWRAVAALGCAAHRVL